MRVKYNYCKKSSIIMVLILVLVFSCSHVAGDGMPAIRYGEWERSPREVFSSMFESRQLAKVELINDSYESISLFLSVFSLDPKENLSIIVPLRTLPVNVSGEPIKEKEFRKTFKINRAEREVIRQDTDIAYGRLGQQSKEYFEFSLGSMVWTYPGEYTHENIHISTGYSTYGSYGGEMSQSSASKPEPIQHYEFDGFSIDIFGIDSGYILSEYLDEKELVLPESEILERYNNHYVAVIESKTKPPISELDFNRLQEYAPKTLEYLGEELNENPDRNKYEINRLKYELHDRIHREIEGYISNYDRNELYDFIDDVVDVVFGETDFEGEVLKIILPLDEGKIFFPLGTSGGWPNNIGDIDILFEVPEDTSLSLPQSKDAFFDGSHWYLVQMENSNPDFDLESSLKSADSGFKTQKELAGFVYDNHQSLGLLIVLAILIILWFAIAYSIKIWRKKEEKIIKNPLLWTLLGISLIISIPGALLILFFKKPIPVKKIPDELVHFTLLIAYPVSVLLFFFGGLL
jgi:hypothetical protein